MSILNTLFDEDENLQEDDAPVEDELSQEAVESELEIEAEEGESEEVADDETVETEASGAVAEPEDDETLDPKMEKLLKASEGRLGAVLAEREKRQSAESELKRLQDQMAEMQRYQQQAQAQNIPDPNYDPQGYTQAIQQQAEMQVIRDRFESSDEIAREKYGAEAVEAAAMWAQTQVAQNPNFQTQMFAQRMPMNWVVAQHQKEQKSERFANDPDAVIREAIERLGYVPAGTVQAPAPVMPVAKTVTKAPPKRAAAASIGSPSKGVDVPTSMTGILGLK